MVKLAQTPAYEWHQKKGAIFENYFGCEIPSHYGNVEQEYRLLRNEAVLRDVSHFGKIKVVGRDRLRFLQGMLTNEIRALGPGEGTFALFLDVKGHIQADMKVYAFPDHVLIVLQHYLVEKLLAGLDRYIMSEDVRMHDVSADLGLVQVLGPQAGAYLQSRNIEALPEVNYNYSTIRIAGSDSHLIRLPSGYAMLVPLSGDAPALLNVLNTLDGPFTGARAFDVFRIENGLPLMHQDMDESNFPQECGLSPALDFQKGCYLGQETMARIDAQGHVNRRLVGVASQKKVLPGDKIFKDNKEVGRITSATHSFLLQQPFALGYVRREVAKEGESVEVGTQNTTAVLRDIPLKG